MPWLTRELRNNLHFVIHGVLYERWSIIYSVGPAICNITTAPPPPLPSPASGDAVSRLAGRINCCVELWSQCEVTVFWQPLALYLLQHCVFTRPSQIRTRIQKRFQGRCQIYSRRSLLRKSGRQVSELHGGPHTSRPFKACWLLLRTNSRNNKKCHILPHYTYVFYADLRTNSDYFPVHLSLTGFYKRGGVCLLRGKDWIFKSLVFITETDVCHCAVWTGPMCNFS